MVRNKGFKRFALIFCLSLCICALFSGAAHATNTGGGKLAWEKSINIFSGSLSGPVAYSLCIVMIILGTMGVIFGGDLQGWVRWACGAAVVVGMAGAAPDIVAALGVSSAIVF